MTESIVFQNKKVRRKANEFVKVLRTNDNGWFNAFNLVEADKTQLGTAEEVVTVGETIAKQVEWTKIYQLVPNFI
jgi:tellurite resistance protein